MGEGTKSVRILAVVVLSLFMLTMVYFTASVIKGFKNGSLRAERDFMHITETASSAVFFDTDSAALNELRNILINNEYVAAALVCSEKNIFFVYPASSPLIGMNIQGKPSLQTSSPMIRIFSTRLAAAPEEDTMLTVALYAVRSADIYNPARISFLVILAGLAALFVMLLFISKSAPVNQGAEKAETAQDSVFRMQERSIPSAQAPGDIFDKKAEPEAEHAFEPAKQEAEPEPFSPPADVSSGEPSLFPAEYHEAEELSTYDEHEAKLIRENMTDPSGLFSPATGMGWEQYLETRLDAELMRSASSEQDLALVLLRIPGIEGNRLMMKKIAAVLLDFFKFRDFVFEYKNDGFAGILLNINLDQTMVLAETVYTQFKELLQSENIPSKLALGISMRSLRLLPGSRLIDEADKALQKAFNETGLPIVAFRVNPDKYRQFVADSARESR
ncbi:diguanylate cyclase [Treponema sp. HNW]|uniref:diguanylate cyclase domain-containing protein n=1 Tax=Treponema sp. HNW TaxID=3116654 RepID=UPI003D0A1357